MQKITLAAFGAAALIAFSGTAARADEATPFCSKSVTDNCLQREGHAATPHRAAPHRAASKHHAAPKHRVAAKHRSAPHRKVAAKPAPAHKM